jgi:hypothetical protein
MHFKAFSKEYLNDFSPQEFNLRSPSDSSYADSAVRATVVWQSILESPQINIAYEEVMKKKNSFSTGLKKKYEKYIVSFSGGRIGLLILDPNYDSSEPYVFDVSGMLSADAVYEGHARWGQQMIDRFPDNQYSEMFGLNLKGLQEMTDAQLIYAYVQSDQWPVVVMKPPPASLTCLYPTTPRSITVPPTYAAGLVGVYAYNEQNVLGVTSCLHGLKPTVVPGLTKVYVNGREGTVHSVHPVSDSCFIEMSAARAELEPIVEALPVFRQVPRFNEPVSFLNKNSSRIETVITGWSPDILYDDPYNQVKLLTPAMTNPGDSGTALINEMNQVLGFSFFRTQLNAPLEFSAWIWAASVFKAHHLIS